MLLAYLPLFLLHASSCGATSRNPRIFFHPRGADVGAPSPAIYDHVYVIGKVHTSCLAERFPYLSSMNTSCSKSSLFLCTRCMQDLFYETHHPYWMMAAPPPTPMLPTMSSSLGIKDLRWPPDKEISVATMAPSPHHRHCRRHNRSTIIAGTT